MCTIGNQIKEIRRILRMTQEDLARAVDIDRASLSNIESGIRMPTIYLLNRIAVALNAELTIELKLKL